MMLYLLLPLDNIYYFHVVVLFISPTSINIITMDLLPLSTHKMPIYQVLLPILETCHTEYGEQQNHLLSGIQFEISCGARDRKRRRDYLSRWPVQITEHTESQAESPLKQSIPSQTQSPVMDPAQGPYPAPCA